jgi:hypothetical protein
MIPMRQTNMSTSRLKMAKQISSLVSILTLESTAAPRKVRIKLQSNPKEAGTARLYSWQNSLQMKNISFRTTRVVTLTSSSESTALTSTRILLLPTLTFTSRGVYLAIVAQLAVRAVKTAIAISGPLVRLQSANPMVPVATIPAAVMGTS